MKSLFAVTVLFSMGQAAAADVPPIPALPKIPDRTFKITDYGAVAGEVTDNTKAIQTTIAAAASTGGGTVEVPSGEFLSGPFQLASGINLHLAAGSTLKMLTLDRYPGGSIDPKNFVSGEGLHDVAITGQGVIDGQGSAWWPLAKKRQDPAKKGDKRPRMIVLTSCERVLIEQVMLMNSPRFHIAIDGKSSDITVQGVVIRAPTSDDPLNPSHNTDACNVTAKRVLLKDCDISVGDDNFTCHGGTSDVLITHCTFGNGHGVSIGSGTDGGISDLMVEDCTFSNTECGIRIKSDRDRGGIVQRLNYRRMRMENVGCAIQIYGTYMATERRFRNLNDLTPAIAATYPGKPLLERTPVNRDITFSQITATVQPGQRAGLIWGLPEAPVSNVLLQDVSITADKPFGIYTAQGVKLENCRIVTPDGVNKLSVGNAQVTLSPP